MCAMPFPRRSRIARWRSGNGSPRSAGSMSWIASSPRSRGSRRASRRSASASAPRSRHATGCRVASFARPPPGARAASARTARCSSISARRRSPCGKVTSSSRSGIGRPDTQAAAAMLPLMRDCKSGTGSCRGRLSDGPRDTTCEAWASDSSVRVSSRGSAAWRPRVSPSILTRPMLLAININNTETKVGLFRGDSLEAHWRLTTTPSRTPDEWAAALTSYLAQEGWSTQEVRAAVVASVVPPVTQGLCEAVERATTVRPVVVDGRSRLPITLDVEEPLQVGADRILNTLAAAQLFHRDSIVVDFGTATTFDCITADGHFLGGVIMPGIRTASDALIRGTAKLPATDLTPPSRTIGRRTEEAIRSGVLLGTADAVDGIVRRIKAEWPNGQTPHVIATGGLASLVAPLVREIESVHPDLTLTGLRIAATALGLEW